MVENTPIDLSEPRATLSSGKDSESDSERTLNVEQHANTVDSPLEDTSAPPDGGYGWVCVACNFFINGHTWGINSSYAVFLSYYLSHDYFPDTSPIAYAFIGGLSISQAMLVAPLATKVVQRYGTRVCMHVGVFFQTASLIGASFAHQKYQIILAQGICFGWGMGFLFVGSVGVIAQWFLKKRSVANAIAASGSGLGGLIYSLGSQSMIDQLGLPWAFRILGICTFVVNMAASNLLKDRNTKVGARHRAFDMALFTRPEFLLLQGWSFFSMLGYVVVLFSLPSYATTIGLSAQQGSIIAALMNLGQMIGRPMIGLASDRWGRLNLATLFSFLCGVFCLAFWIPAEVPPPGQHMGLLTFFAIVGGALAGTFWCTIAPVGAEVVGLRDLPSGLSWTWVLMVPPTTFAEPIALELRKAPSSSFRFLNAQIFTAIVYMAGALCLWVVRAWKVGEMEELQRRAAEEEEKKRDGNDDGRLAAPTLTEKEALADEAVVRARSDSITKELWNPRDLMRRMWAWKVV